MLGILVGPKTRLDHCSLLLFEMQLLLDELDVSRHGWHLKSGLDRFLGVVKALTGTLTHFTLDLLLAGVTGRFQIVITVLGLNKH